VFENPLLFFITQPCEGRVFKILHTSAENACVSILVHIVLPAEDEKLADILVLKAELDHAKLALFVAVEYLPAIPDLHGV